MYEKTCLWCSTRFTTNRYKRMFCSKSCSLRHRNTKPRSQVFVMKQCPECHGDFESRRCLYRTFCSRQCAIRHDGRRRRLPVHARLYGRAERVAGGCWNFMGYKDHAGYGRIVVDGKLRPAHCVSYELEHGPIPEGLEINHLCRNRACVNPEHLEAVSHRVNIQYSKGTTATHWGCGHERNESNTIRRATGIEACRRCICLKAKESYRRNAEKRRQAIKLYYYRARLSQ